MKRVWGLLIVGLVSIATSAHAERFRVGDKTYKTAEEARAAADNNRTAWINLFNPDLLIASGLKRIGGKAIFLMPDDQYIKENFEKIKSQKSILSQKKPTNNQELEFARSIRLSIETTPLILARLSYFDKITSVNYGGNPEILNLDLYDADYVIYMTLSDDYDPKTNGILVDGDKNSLHQFQNRDVLHTVKFKNNGKSRVFFKTLGTPYLFYGSNPYGIIHSLSDSIEKIKE